MMVVSVVFYWYGLSFFMIGLNRTAWKRLGIADERNELSRNRRRKPENLLKKLISAKRGE